MCGGNNVVGCFADCQPRSGILLSTPLGLTATGTARRRKSPLIWSWKERGKVILGCLRRWVIRPAVAGPHSRVQFRLPPAGGGTAQGLGSWPAGKQPAGSGAPGWGPARVGVGSCVCTWTEMRRETLGHRGREGRKEPINTLFVRESSFPNCFGCRV